MRKTISILFFLTLLLAVGVRADCDTQGPCASPFQCMDNNACYASWSECDSQCSPESCLQGGSCQQLAYCSATDTCYLSYEECNTNCAIGGGAICAPMPALSSCSDAYLYENCYDHCSSNDNAPCLWTGSECVPALTGCSDTCGGAPSGCAPGEFDCNGDGSQCIASYQQCDQIQQCANGADEPDSCEYCSCGSDADRCRNSAFPDYSKLITPPDVGDYMACVGTDCNINAFLNCHLDADNCPNSAQPYYDGFSGCFADQWCRSSTSETCPAYYIPGAGPWYFPYVDAQYSGGSVQDEPNGQFLFMGNENEYTDFKAGIEILGGSGETKLTMCFAPDSNSGPIDIYAVNQYFEFTPGSFTADEFSEAYKDFIKRVYVTETDACNCIEVDGLPLSPYIQGTVVHLILDVPQQNCGTGSGLVKITSIDPSGLGGVANSVGGVAISEGNTGPEFNTAGLVIAIVLIAAVVLVVTRKKK
jgi:LPXTG-motif cell wall-anchored protein